MSDRAPTSPPPTLHIGQLRLISDGVLGDRDEQALANRFASDLQSALARVGLRRAVHIGELEVDVRGQAQRGPVAMAHLAERVAQSIFDRVSD